MNPLPLRRPSPAGISFSARASVAEEFVTDRLRTNGTRVDGWAITGGASGIGLATAERFAAEGARVVIADLDEAGGKHAAEGLGPVEPK